MVLHGAGVSKRDHVPPKKIRGNDQPREARSRSKRQLPRIDNPIRILMRSRSNKNKNAVKGRLEKFFPLRNSKSTDLNTTGLSMTDSSNGATTCLDVSLTSSPTLGKNVDESSDHTEHESFTQLDVPEMLCRKESGLTQFGIESSDLVLTRTASYVARERDKIIRPKSQDVSQSTTECSDRMEEREEMVAAKHAQPEEKEEATIDLAPAAWLPPLDLDYLISLTNADPSGTDDRPLAEIHIPLSPQGTHNAERSKSFPDKVFERTQRDEIFRHFLDDTFQEKSRQNYFPRRVRTNMTGGLFSNDFPSLRDFPSSLPEEVDIKSDLTTIPSSGGMRLRKVQSAWTPARARRTQLAMQEKEMFLSKKGPDRVWDKPSFDDTEVLALKPCLVQTRSLNEKYEQDVEKDSLMNFPTNGERLFGSTKTVASTDDSNSVYATSDDLDTNSVPDFGAACGLLCTPFIEMNKQPARNCDESVHSEDFSVLLRKQIGAKRSSTELINEIRSEVLETVQELARGGSNVVRKFVEERGNRK